MVIQPELPDHVKELLRSDLVHNYVCVDIPKPDGHTKTHLYIYANTHADPENPAYDLWAHDELRELALEVARELKFVDQVHIVPVL